MNYWKDRIFKEKNEYIKKISDINRYIFWGDKTILKKPPREDEFLSEEEMEL